MKIPGPAREEAGWPSRSHLSERDGEDEAPRDLSGFIWLFSRHHGGPDDVDSPPRAARLVKSRWTIAAPTTEIAPRGRTMLDGAVEASAPKKTRGNKLGRLRR